METATKVNIGGSCENFSPNSDTLRDRANSDRDFSRQPLPEATCPSAALSETLERLCVPLVARERTVVIGAGEPVCLDIDFRAR